MADGKIYITISDERGKGGENVPVPTPVEPEEPKEKKKKDEGNWLLHQFYDFVQSQARQFVNQSINNIGNFTGDYNVQRNVETAKSTITKLGGIAMSTAIYGWAGLLVSSATTLANDVHSNISAMIENQKQNQEIERIRKISGLNSLYDGSRGTQS